MKNFLMSAGLVASLTLVSSCKNENPTIDVPDASAVDAPPGTPDAPVAPTFVQVEHLARPGINEAFLLTDAFNNGYNATAPSFAGAPAAAVTAIVAEAKTVMKALYLGVCLVNGAAGLTAQSGLSPAGTECHAVGGAIFTENAANGVTLTAASQTAAAAYADAVFAAFIPDVMRIDTAVNSGYLTLCNTGKALLCGGRKLNEDVIDITYNFLLSGARVDKMSSSAQLRALVSDGVNFSADDSQNSGNVISSTGIANPHQYHPPISATFPYSAPPL